MRNLLFILLTVFLANGTPEKNISTVTILLDSAFTKENQQCYIAGWISSDEYYVFDSAFIKKNEQTIQLKISHSKERTFSIYFSKCGPINKDFSLEPNAEVTLQIVPEMRNEEGTFILTGKGSEAHNENRIFRRDVINPLMKKLKTTLIEDSINYYKQLITSSSINIIKNTSHPTVAYSNFLALETGFESFLGKKKIKEIKDYIINKFTDIDYIQRVGQTYVPRELSEEANRVKKWKTNIITERYKALQQDTEIGARLNLSFSDKQGIPISVDDMKEEYVLVDIWASWCKPCLKEIPNIKKALEKHKEKLCIYAVSLDGYLDSWQKAIEDNNLNDFTHVIGTDPQGIPNKRIKGIGVKAIPANFLLNKERRIVAKDLRGEQLMQTLDSLTNQ